MTSSNLSNANGSKQSVKNENDIKISNQNTEKSREKALHPLSIENLIGKNQNIEKSLEEYNQVFDIEEILTSVENLKSAVFSLQENLSKNLGKLFLILKH